MYACDSTTAVAREQLRGYLVFSAREHARMEDMFSVRSVPGLLVSDVKDSSVIHMKGNVRRWKPLPSNG
jgi:hypothetical protein